jgi:hypothetical protein
MLRLGLDLPSIAPPCLGLVWYLRNDLVASRRPLIFGRSMWLLPSTIAYAGSARDYLNAPIDSRLVTYNSGYSTSVTPEDGIDISPPPDRTS